MTNTDSPHNADAPAGSSAKFWIVPLGLLILILVALMLPAVGLRGELTRRECIKNLKQIGLALYNYHVEYGQFPGNIVGKDTKPLLSWRVAILPYIEERELYNKFKLDESWDGPHNKPLLNEIPKFLQCPSHSRSDPPLTTYLGFEGPGACFKRGKEVKIEDFTNGLSNTLAVVEAEEGTPWSKPSDLPFDESAPPSLYGAGSDHSGGFNALFADGSVRFLKATISPSTFKALITRNGGEPIGPDPY